MGNLRQSMTEEEWEDLGKIVKLNPTPNYTDYSTIFRKILYLTKTIPNDQELGNKIRELIKFGGIE